jgi:hypothetical protein
MLRKVSKLMRVLQDPQHFWREVVRNARHGKGRCPKDWLLFRHTLMHECAIRRSPAGGLPQVRAEELFPQLRGCPVLASPAPRNPYNPSWHEIITIAGLVRVRQPRTLFEFGTFDGRTTLHLAMNSPEDAVVHTIDIAVGSFNLGPDGAYMDRVTVGEAFLASPYRCKIAQITADSRKFDYAPFAGKVDFVFVDAGHAYDDVMSDSAAAFRMVRPGGVVVWHDYLTIGDVTRALIELRNSRDLVSLIGTTLALWQAPSRGESS